MVKNLRRLSFAASSIVYATLIPGAFAAWQVESVFGITVSGGNAPLSSLINQILGILYSISGGCALVMIVFGAYRYMSASGDAKAVQEAKDTITSAFYGLVLILLAYLLAQVIGGDALTNLNM
ncbi:hypothetical protein AUK40_03575 [Candidatus Wirthbacteria bacterium CG2_30_54_11]|uniref:Uncharacterized protein n=1 Tax=Candidatus Wirthbacteria bacterium CG2_30_54_11 TaxID=1817892 RepID=A0A1J5ISB9_9BACT|nr:MAG: hypothetical protein AUK40_03575 [Candidatus Wirthbacteria bacterium CG2_30_54_11]